MSKDVKNCVEGEMVKIVTQLGPHETKLRAYRWNNMVLVITADCAVWYFADKSEAGKLLAVLEDMVLGSVCETASYWFDDSQELTLEGFINGMVNDKVLAEYIAKDGYKDSQVLIRRNGSSENLKRLVSKIDGVVLKAFEELEQHDRVEKSLEGVEISVKIGNDLFCIDVNADTLDNMRVLAMSEITVNLSKEAR